MLSSSCNLFLIEKCKIAIWMEQFQNALKVQSKFKLEFFKYPPPVSEIIKIHQRFMTTGSVIDKFDDTTQDTNAKAEELLNGFGPKDAYEKNIKLPLKEKWKDRPNIKISDREVSSTRNEGVSITPEDLNEDEIKECMIEISLNEDCSGILVNGEKNSTRHTCIHCGHKSSDKLSHCRHDKIHSTSDFFSCPNCDFTCNNTSLLRSHRAACKPCDSNVNWAAKQEVIYSTYNDMDHNSSEKDTLFLQRQDLNDSAYSSECPSEKNLDLLRSMNVQSCVNVCDLPKTSKYIEYVEENIASTCNKINQTQKRKIFSCDECSFTTQKKVVMKNHKTIHCDDKEMKHECHFCGQKFRSKRSLSYHMDNSHIDKELLECPFCDFRQKNKILLQIHMRRHTGEKPYKCERPNCDFRARISHELRRHLQMEHSPTYKKHIVKGS